jgi:hypothetical protein
MSDDAFAEAVDYAGMLGSADCKSEVGSPVYRAAQELTNEETPRAERIETAEALLQDSLPRRDPDEYREALRESNVQDPLDLAAGVSRFDTLVQELATSSSE